MVHVLLFHHAQGITSGVEAFADDLRAAGHQVTVPDLFEGRTFATVEDGVAHAEELGFRTVIDRGVAVADPLPADLVYAGFSLGLLPAQYLAQQRSGARGVLLYHGAVPPTEFGGTWPAAVPAQIHLMEGDPWEELSQIERVAAELSAELFVYPGDRHLFIDRSSPDHDEAAALLAFDRSLAFLDRLG